MDRIISWKINSSKYAYIVKVNGDSHISNRITDSSTIQDIIDEVEGWGSNAETKYEANYKELSEEVSKTYGIQMPENWKEFYSYKNGYSGITNTNLVILTGKDGNGSGSGDGSNLLSEEDWNRLEEEIKNKLAAQSAWTREQIDKVNGYVTEMVNEEIKNANKRIDDAKQDLEDAKKKLEGDIDDAQKDLDSFASGITNLDTEAIKNSISGLSSVQQWLKDYSGKTVEIIADYDDAMKTGGLIGTSTDATIGLFSRYAICLNNVSGTVGQVNSYMLACAATIGNVAKWYDGSASSMTELQSYIDAKKGVIAQLADFIDNSANTQNSIARIVDARAASITDKATSSSDGSLNTITNEINALSGYVHTSLVTQDKYTSGITSITSTMDSMKGEITRALTIQKELSGDVTSLAESWNEESGKLSTVYNLVYDEKTGGYSSGFGSYVQQCVNHISLNVNSGDIYAALNLRVTDDGKSLIYADADEIMLNGEVIGESLRFTKGNIGGIYLGQGRIVQTGGMWELNSAGTLLAKNASISGNVYATDGVFSGSVYATDGYFKGDIVANTLTLGADYGNQTLMEYISEKTGGSGVTTGEVNSLITQYLSSTAFTNTMTKNGYITESDMQEYISSLDLDGQGIDGEKLSALCKTLVGAEISNVFGSSANSDGSITHSVKIGDKTYEWTTYDAGKYLVVDSALSGESGSSFVVSKQGLLQANNAVIYGKIYASEGKFKGTIEGSTIKGTIICGTTINGSEITVGVEDDERNCYCYLSYDEDDNLQINLTKAIDTDLNFELAGHSYYYAFVEAGSKSATFSTQDNEYLTKDDVEAEENSGGFQGVLFSGNNMSSYNVISADYEGLGIMADYFNGQTLIEASSTGYFKVGKDGSLVADNATICGNIKLKGDNSFIMEDSGGAQTILISSTPIKLENDISTFTMRSPVSKFAYAEGYYENMGYAVEDDESEQSITLYNFTLKSGSSISSYPSIDIGIAKTSTNGNTNAYVTLYYYYNGVLKSTRQINSSQSNYSLKNLTGEISVTNTAIIMIKASVVCYARAQAPSSSSDRCMATAKVTISQNAAISTVSQSSNSNCFRIGPNGMQVKIGNNGSNLTFGVFDGQPVFSMTIYSGNTGKVVSQIVSSSGGTIVK